MQTDKIQNKEEIIILIVEDSPTQAEELKYLLEKNNFKVIVANNGKEGLASLQKHNPNIIISDIIMPEMDGFEFCKKIKDDEKLRFIPVILLTSLSDPKDVIKGLECGADNFISKPYNENLLITRIQYILAALELRKDKSSQMGLEVFFGGKKYFITAERQQILDLLLSTYETAIQQNVELNKTRDELKILNEQLEEKVEEKTKSLLEEIEERKKTERKLKVALEQLNNVFEHLEEVFFSVDVINKKLLLVSPACKKVYGFSEKYFFNNHLLWKQVIYPDDLARVEKKQLDLHQGKSIYDEYRIIRADKEIRWVNAKVSPVLDEAGNLIRLDGIVSDITEHKNLNLEKEKIQNQIHQMQKMEAVGTLTGGIAHDFNNILTAIQGFTELSLMQIDEKNTLHKNLKQIHKASLSASELTKQLLLFSHKQIVEFKLLNPNKVINDLLNMLTRLIGEDIVIKTELIDNVWTIQADKGNLEQIIMNLCVNARDAMPKGGTITIKTENITVDETYIKFNVQARVGNFVCISVNDNGIGMSKEIVNRIFEPFFTTKKESKGTGLGLSIIFGIVNQHNGWINVYSEVGQGTLFKIYLPADLTKLEKTNKKTSAVEITKGEGKKILVVEDDEKVRQLVVQALNENGYLVFEASNAETAINIFKKEAGNFQLVFTDVVMPGKSGLQLIEELLLLKPNINILISSGYTKDKSQLSAVKEKGINFIQKPYAIDDLFKAIKNAMRNL